MAVLRRSFRLFYGGSESWVGLRFIVPAFIGIGLILYLGLLTINFDGTGIIEMQAVDMGGSELFSPNHMLYRPLVWLLVQVFGGTPTKDLFIGQVVTATFAAVGLGLFAWWVTLLTSSRFITTIATIGFGTSWGYWVFGTDVYYITPAAAAILAALVALTYELKDNRPRLLRLVIASVATVVGTLFWQENIFFLVFIWIVYGFKYRMDWRNLVYTLGVTSVIVLGLTGLTYLVASFSVLQAEWSVSAFLSWPIHYGGGDAGIWGVSDPGRIFPTIHSAVSSIVPLWEGLGLHSTTVTGLYISKLLNIASLIAFIILGLFSAGLLIRRRQAGIDPQRGWLALVIVGYLVYMPFNIWWDPFEPKWFVVPAIMFWALIALIWNRSTENGWRLSRVLLVVLVLTITSANFVSRIWPDHTVLRAQSEKEVCLASHMQPDDLFVSFNWTGLHLSYVHERNVYRIVPEFVDYSDVSLALADLKGVIKTTQQNNGAVYTDDISIFGSAEWVWLASLVDIDASEFDFVHGAQVFECSNEAFIKMDAL